MFPALVGRPLFKSTPKPQRPLVANTRMRYYAAQGKDGLAHGPLTQGRGSGQCSPENTKACSSSHRSKISNSHLPLSPCQTAPLHTQDAEAQRVGAGPARLPRAWHSTPNLLHCSAAHRRGTVPKVPLLGLAWIWSLGHRSPWALSSRLVLHLSWSRKQLPSRWPCARWPAPQR